MRFLVRAVALLPFATLALYAPACSHDDHQDAPAPGTEDVLYDPHADTPTTPAPGGPTDEALVRLLAATPVDDVARGAGLEEPAAGAALPADPAPTFRWRIGASPVDAGTGWRAPRAVPFAWPFGGERSARAHGLEFSGTAFLIVFSTPTDPKLLRVFTLRTTFTPEAAAWQRLRAAGGPVTARVTLARFTNDVIDPDGGPFRGAPVSFSIKP